VHQQWVRLTQLTERRDVADQDVIGVFPVEPRQGIVLAPGVIVAGLSATEFITSQQQGRVSCPSRSPGCWPRR
jgi:hypothetical protein